MQQVNVFDTGVLLVLGVLGGTLAAFAGLPMPYMLGSLGFSAAYTIFQTQRDHVVKFPRNLRFFFIATIGTMIGARFTPELLGLFPQYWPSFLALIPFVLVAYAFGYTVLRRVGRYDRATATYAALPGGLIEAITMGEREGADVRVLTVQHFARIIVVVVSVPLLFLFIGGEAVGSAAGQTMADGKAGWIDLCVIAVLAPLGLWLGRRLGLPAGQLMGPLVLCGIAHVTGLLSLHSPFWLLPLAQLVVGAGLGAQFAGASAGLLIKAFSLGVVNVAGILAIGASAAFALRNIVPGGFEPLFISFAPGGMTEMALIALSLEASPVIVTAHHLFRILLAVVVVGWVGKRQKARGAAE
ncbi:AbrB family transcriptional regulator [Psychromarinibacter sp. S121]|uniref:AbrB family transcriptional regulator n=1 Tax=Psychromarinibacter sp. S121 TaxID=3415127 RepID=UPI003C7B0FE2